MIKKVFATVVVLLVLGMGVGAYFYNRLFMPNVEIKGADKTYVYIRAEADFAEVVDSLKPFLENISSFKQVAELKKYPKLIKPGKYEIQNNWSNVELVNHLRSGNQAEIKLVFNYANSVEEVAGKVSRQISADSLDILNYVYSDEFLKRSKFTKETVPAMFIPNTYHVYWNTSAESFVNRMLKEYKRFWNKKRLARAKEIKLTPLEVSVLASIVQKETAKKDERKTVAGLYMNRLNNNWRLESCPTVLYAIEKESNFTIKRKRLLYDDLEMDTPYNTYKNSGLPPGPIAIPEIDAIDAVLYYEKNSYFYMNASVDKPGYNVFSKSLRQHNINAKKYQAWLNKQNIKK
jgi:UPF0755 protein